MSDRRWITQNTLLQRAKDPTDEVAWDAFVEYYRDFLAIALWKMGVSDADDLIQEILVRIWKELPKFEIDPDRALFRTWLNRLIRNITLDAYKKEKRYRDHHAKIDITTISEPESEALIEREWRTYITNLALKNVQKIFTGKAFEVFTRSLDGEAPNAISSDLGISEGSVYTLKARVRDSMIQEINRLRRELEL